MLAVQKPSVCLENVRCVSDIRGKDRVVLTNAVDLESELDGNAYFSREADDRGPAEASSIDDEFDACASSTNARATARLRFSKDSVKSPGGGDSGELPDSLGLVVPGVATAEEAHDQTRARRKRHLRLDVLEADSGTSDTQNERKSRSGVGHQ